MFSKRRDPSSDGFNIPTVIVIYGNVRVREGDQLYVAFTSEIPTLLVFLFLLRLELHLFYIVSTV